MRKFLPFLFAAALASSCIDNAYDLSNVTTDDVTIGDEDSFGQQAAQIGAAAHSDWALYSEDEELTCYPAAGRERSPREIDVSCPGAPSPTPMPPPGAGSWVRHHLTA